MGTAGSINGRETGRQGRAREQDRGQGHGQDWERTREETHETQTQGQAQAQARPAHGLDATQERLRAELARERPAVAITVVSAAPAERERPDALALVAEQLRDDVEYAPSFATPAQAQAFREEMERRFDPDTLARLGRGEARALAEVAPNRLDGLCVARAYLDAQGEPPRSQARIYLIDASIDARHDARRERQAHEQDGHDWGL